MDKLSLVGAILALVALLLGSVLKGAGIESLWSPAAFVIVVIGTFASIMLQTHMSTFLLAFKLVKWVFMPPAQDRAGVLAKIVEWSNTARKQGLLGLEAQVKEQDDAFIKKGLQMVVDGIEPESIRNVLETDMHHQQTRDTAAASRAHSSAVSSPWNWISASGARSATALTSFTVAFTNKATALT